MCVFVCVVIPLIVRCTNWDIGTQSAHIYSTTQKFCDTKGKKNVVHAERQTQRAPEERPWATGLQNMDPTSSSTPCSYLCQQPRPSRALTAWEVGIVVYDELFDPATPRHAPVSLNSSCGAPPPPVVVRVVFSVLLTLGGAPFFQLPTPPCSHHPHHDMTSAASTIL